MLTYLASAYSHPDPEMREIRFREVCRCAASLFKNGQMVFSPIAHSHPIAVYGNTETDFDNWRDYDFMMIKKCDKFAIVKVSGDWLASKGVINEFMHWRKLVGKSNPMAIIYDANGKVLDLVELHQYIDVEFWKNKQL